MTHKSDLKHTSTAKARAEYREKKAIEGLRVVQDELRVGRVSGCQGGVMH